MNGIFVVEVEYEKVREVLLEEMGKVQSDIPMYLRNLELIKLKDEDGIAIRLDSLTTRKNTAGVTDKDKAKKEMKLCDDSHEAE